MPGRPHQYANKRRPSGPAPFCFPPYSPLQPPPPLWPSFVEAQSRDSVLAAAVQSSIGNRGPGRAWASLGRVRQQAGTRQTRPTRRRAAPPATLASARRREGRPRAAQPGTHKAYPAVCRRLQTARADADSGEESALSAAAQHGAAVQPFQRAVSPAALLSDRDVSSLIPSDATRDRFHFRFRFFYETRAASAASARRRKRKQTTLCRADP